MSGDDLYGLPLDRFVPERAALARVMRADGRRAEAADVAKLRKPSLAAWAVNQLVRTQGRALGELFDAGDAVRGAQEDVLAGRGDGHSLRAAADRVRVAVDALTSAAGGLLSSDGHELSAVVLERVADTMHAAALDDGARASVREGRLERELRHVGFDVGASAGAVGAPGAPERSRTKKSERAKKTGGDARGRQAEDTSQKLGERKRTAQERATAQRVERERAQARRAARAAESDTRRAADSAARALRVAEQRRERAARALRDADEALATARAQADTAAEAYRALRGSMDVPRP